MSNPISVRRKQFWGLFLVIWLVTSLLIFVGYIPYYGLGIPIISGLEIAIRIGIFTTLIAAGIPALYQIHITWVKQPEIVSDLGFSKTFLVNKKLRCNTGDCDWVGREDQLAQQEDSSVGHCPLCGNSSFEQIKNVIPTLVAKMRVKNVGEQTARNSFLTFSSNPDMRWYGRWAVPENPEKFDLHPKDERDIHIFRTYIDIDEKIEESTDDGNYVLASPKKFHLLDDGDPDYEDGESLIEVRSQIPRSERPEEQGKSSLGGWRGNQISLDILDPFSIEYSYSAEDWFSDDREDRILLEDQLTDGTLWQSDWESRIPDIVDHTESRLIEILSR